MNTGTQAAREAGNMVDLDSNPTKLIEIVEIGKQLLMTRGSLTTFSIANDVAKYFAILPAIFVATYATTPGGRGPLHVLNIMHLGNPQSAIVSAIIFNAIVIPLLIPLSLRGVRYRPIGASALLRRRMAAEPVARNLTPRNASGMRATMTKALKMTAERTALVGLCNLMIFSVFKPGYVASKRAGMMAKYLATSLAIEKVVSEPRVISSCLPISTTSINFVGLESRSTIKNGAGAAPGSLASGPAAGLVTEWN